MQNLQMSVLVHECISPCNLWMQKNHFSHSKVLELQDSFNRNYKGWVRRTLLTVLDPLGLQIGLLGNEIADLRLAKQLLLESVN